MTATIGFEKITPYVGPRPFQRTDLELFFGRDEETEDIVSLIFGNPVVLVYAESGAGKTSLFNTQITYTLNEYNCQVLPLVRVGGKLPTNIDRKEVENFYIFNVLESLSPDDHPMDLLRVSLTDFLKRRPFTTTNSERSSLRILIIDQFEELFNFYPENWQKQRDDFFVQLRYAVNADRLLRIVLVIREDYLAQLDPFADYLPESLRARFRLVRLDREAALLAITGPLEKTKRSYAKGVAEDLVEELLQTQVEGDSGSTTRVRGDYVEPVQLQVVCERLWDKLPSDVSQITKEYVGDVDNALSDFYEKAIHLAITETNVQENILRDWCETKLITSSGTRNIIHKETKTTGDMPNTVVCILERERLIRVEQRSGARWYELTHDRLITPIKSSNKAWRLKQEELRYEQEKQRAEQERRRKNLVLRIAIPTVVAVTVVSVIVIYSLLISNPMIKQGTIGVQPVDVSVNPTKNIAYVVNGYSHTVSVIDGKTNTVIANITVGKNPIAVSVNPSTNAVYVANRDDNTVSVIDGKTNTVIAIK